MNYFLLEVTVISNEFLLKSNGPISANSHGARWYSPLICNTKPLLGSTLILSVKIIVWPFKSAMIQELANILKPV